MTIDRKKELIQMLKNNQVKPEVITKAKEILTRPADSATGEKYITLTESGAYRLRIQGTQRYSGPSLEKAIEIRNQVLTDLEF